MTASLLIEEKKFAHSTNFSMGGKFVLPGNNNRKHILDSFNIHRRPRTTCNRVSIPNGSKQMDSKYTYAKLKQVEEKTKKALEQKKKDLINTVKETSTKWRRLQNEEEKLKTYFVEFNNFINGNAERRNRCLLQGQRNQDKFRRFSAKIEILKLQLEKLKIIQLLFKMEINKHLMYNDYLQAAVDNSGNRFMNIQELIETFEVFFTSLENIAQLNKQSMHQLEEKHTTMKLITVDRKPELIQLRLQIQNLSKKYYEVVRLRNSENEKLILSVCTKIHESTMEYEECLRNINELYCLICRRLEVPEIFSKGDFMSQIFFIKYVLGLQRH